MRLIDADTLKTDYFVPSTSSGTVSTQYVSLFQILNAPTIDAVEVVRCKDCKYCYEEGFVNVRNVCEKHYDLGNVDDDWFCADGEVNSDEMG